MPMMNIVFTQKGLRLRTLMRRKTAQTTVLANWPVQKKALSTGLDLYYLSKLSNFHTSSPFSS